MAIDFKNSLSDPIAVDVGNIATRGMTVSKTVKFGLFGTNKNAVWAAQNQLRKESFPFGVLSIVTTRDAFRLQVGDCFKFSYADYSIIDMICRVISIQEGSLEQGEKITVHAIEDVFSKTNSITTYSAPVSHAPAAQNYAVEAFDYQAVIEAPYVLAGDTIQIIPMACRKSAMDMGFFIYMSVDGGASYSILDSCGHIQPYGVLNEAYGITQTRDETQGFEVEFKGDATQIESVTWADIYSGNRNTALVGDEIISFRDITPVSGDIYKITNVIRGRFGTQKQAHLAGEDFWFVGGGISLFSHTELTAGAVRKFKLVPYNMRRSGDISDADEISLTIAGEARKPYETPDFRAQGESFNPLYTSGNDIVLTWSPTKRGQGAGIGVPGVAVATSDVYEGLYRVEVWVGGSKVRETTDINALTWTYTDAMNTADNTTPADEIEFKLYNYITDNGFTYECDAASVTCTKE